MYRRGDIYRLEDTLYILASIDARRMVLISLTDGNRWNDGWIVTDPNAVSKREFNHITSDAPFKFVSKSLLETIKGRHTKKKAKKKTPLDNLRDILNTFNAPYACYEYGDSINFVTDDVTIIELFDSLPNELIDSPPESLPSGGVVFRILRSNISTIVRLAGVIE